MAKKNIPLLKRLRTRFLRMRHKRHFNMEDIARDTDCGAAMCFIGHTLALSGYKMRKLREGEKQWLSDFKFIDPAGRAVRNPFRRAQRELGLTKSEASRLFHAFEIKTPKAAAERVAELIEQPPR